MTDGQENYTNLPIGEILRRVRLQHRLEYAQIESDIRIKAIYLEALETGDYERLPGQVYVTGFIKVYSDYLGLDSDKMIQLMKKQTGHKVSRPTNIFPVVTEEQKVPNLKIIIASSSVLFILLLGWQLSHRSPGDTEVPEVPKDLTQQLTAPQKPPEEKTATTAAEAEKPKPHPVVLKAVQDVWLEIHDGTGKPVFSRVLKTGEEYWIPEDATGYKMTTGNAGGLDVVVEGESMKPLGRIGEVRRNISLNPQDLKVFAAAGPAKQN